MGRSVLSVLWAGLAPCWAQAHPEHPRFFTVLTHGKSLKLLRPGPQPNAPSSACPAVWGEEEMLIGAGTNFSYLVTSNGI